MTLHGVRAPRLFAGAWLRSLAGPLLKRPGVVTYVVQSETILAYVERRAATRRTVHLQSGKMLDHADRFLTEFTVRNRTDNGVRLKLARRVQLPRSVVLFDDQQGILLAADVIWRNGADAGLRISRRQSLDEKLLKRLEGRYYAVE